MHLLCVPGARFCVVEAMAMQLPYTNTLNHFRNKAFSFVPFVYFLIISHSNFHFSLSLALSYSLLRHLFHLIFGGFHFCQRHSFNLFLNRFYFQLSTPILCTHSTL